MHDNEPFSLNGCIGLLNSNSIPSAKQFGLSLFKYTFIYMNLLTERNTPDFAKDTVYRFMKMLQINWIRFTTILSSRIFKDAIVPLDSDECATDTYSVIPFLI